ncbi:MAG: hypothetical protein COT43_02330 [Candidatus Marinimicrobia bacterium CG08_land_8_20_14_0_20_45_22]|nr:MAG: hypothetical protein COT43_02330 [Candidatus Marinimicrobia bacterium CG08_land_8_20_14_0_20_45_22]
MKPNNTFDRNRFFILVRNDLSTGYRNLLIAGGAVAGALLVIYLLSAWDNANPDFHRTFFPMVIFFGGYLTTSMIFKDIHEKQRNYIYLTLPASTLEKFLSRLLLTSVGFVAIVLVLYSLFSWIAAGLSQLLFDQSLPAFQPFTHETLISIGVYLVTQSAFLFAAVYFQSHAFFKTILSIFSLTIAFSIFTMLIVRLVFWEYFNGLFMQDFNIDLQYMFGDGEPFVQIISTALKILFWFVMAPFFWILTYFRLKEAEA